VATYNLKGIRNAIFSQMDWAPAQSRVAVERANGFIDRGYMQLCQDAPFLFFEDEARWPVHHDRTPGIEGDTLTTTTDPWVLETTLVAGATGALAWEDDRSWSGRTLLALIPGTSPEQWMHLRIRDVWTYTNPGDGLDYIRLSLYTPWRNTSDTAIEYRVISDEYTFPDDIVQLKSASLLDESSYPRPLEVVGQMQAEYGTYPHNPQYQTGGPPSVLYRREYQSLQAPTQAPITSLNETAWVGPEPTGEFEYIFTYIWGKQEVWSHAPGPETQTGLALAEDRYEPYWESPPSAVSDAVDSSTATKEIRLTLPNIEFTLGFGDAATPRYGHSGMRKRIYRRRNTSSVNTHETPNTFFLLDEVDGITTVYDDDGSITPDYNRPLREVHGYQTFRLHPRPNRRYQLVIRFIRRPRPLTDDADTPKVLRDGIETLILRSMAYAYEAQGNAAMAERVLGQYEKALFALKKRYADLRPSNRPHQRNIAHPGKALRRRRDLAGLVNNS
jgi:hypothetical protein